MAVWTQGTPPPGRLHVTPDGKHYLRLIVDGEPTWVQVRSDQQLAEARRVYGNAVPYPQFNTARAALDVPGFFGMGGIRQYANLAGLGATNAPSANPALGTPGGAYVRSGTAPEGAHHVTPDGRHFLRIIHNGSPTWIAVDGPEQLKEVERVYGAATEYPQFDPSRIVGNIPSFFGMGGIRVFQPVGTGTPPNQPPGTPPGAGQPGVDEDAYALIVRTLESYGLGSLAGWAREMIIAKATPNQILLELRNRPEFKDRFGVLFELPTLGLAPMSPEQVIAYESQTRQIMRASGLPEGMFDTHQDLQNLIRQGLSVAEVAEVIEDGFVRVRDADPLVRSLYQEWFGGDGDTALAMQFLYDVDLPTLRRRVGSAEVGGSLKRFGVDVGQGGAEELFGLGVDQQRALQGGAQIDELAGVFRETISEREDMTPEREGVAAVFNTKPGARRQLERRVSQRRAAVSGGGGAFLSGEGVRGLGTAE